MDAKTEVTFNSKEQDTHPIISRQIEAGILEELIDVWEEMIKPKKKRDSYPNDSLKQDLQRRYNDWQFRFGKDKMGLESGGCGEAFMRLLGSGIMSDMPEIGSLPYNTDEYGVSYSKAPKGKDDIGRIEVMVAVGRWSEDYKGCKFTFETSLNTLGKRLTTVRKEIDVFRKEYFSKHDG